MKAAASETVVADLTPKGRGAVAVVVVSGPDATRAVDRCFTARRGHTLDEIPLGRIAIGHWGDAGGEELVLCRRSAEKVEVHCHGGVAAVEAVISQLVAEGCQRRTWQEWIDQSTPDRVQGAARIALADATTERTAGILLDQLNGALSAAIRKLVTQIANGDWMSVATAIDELLHHRDLGLHLVHPWRVVVFGAPNVGKSSLINALAGYQRAIVSAIPGTTRDVVTVNTAIDGWPVQLSDTAGIRETLDELERAGIGLATSTIARADLAVAVYDAEQIGRGARINNMGLDPSALTPQARIVFVLNKIDTVADADRPQLVRQFVTSHAGDEQPLLLSALTGEGIRELISTIGRSLVPIPVPAGSAVPFNLEHFDRLVAAKSAIEQRSAEAATLALRAMVTETSM
jgi:tRNA modification GTPase